MENKLLDVVDTLDVLQKQGIPLVLHSEWCTCGFLMKFLDKEMYSWSVILSGFVGSGFFNEALRLLREFWNTHSTYDGFVITSVWCRGGVAGLMLGKEVHGCAYRRRYESDVLWAIA
ncbi:hypothetical protein EJ110_NYTH10762 [Nymphaea thermarum]|nr:hypothetical protein EJ110_NYTH10762 [Nymphaea thermarum]